MSRLPNQDLRVIVDDDYDATGKPWRHPENRQWEAYFRAFEGKPVRTYDDINSRLRRSMKTADGSRNFRLFGVSSDKERLRAIAALMRAPYFNERGHSYYARVVPMARDRLHGTPRFGLFIYPRTDHPKRLKGMGLPPGAEYKGKYPGLNFNMAEDHLQTNKERYFVQGIAEFNDDDWLKGKAARFKFTAKPYNERQMELRNKIYTEKGRDMPTKVKFELVRGEQSEIAPISVSPADTNLLPIGEREKLIWDSASWVAKKKLGTGADRGDNPSSHAIKSHRSFYRKRL